MMLKSFVSVKPLLLVMGIVGLLLIAFGVGLLTFPVVVLKILQYVVGAVSLTAGVWLIFSLFRRLVRIQNTIE